VHWRSGLATHVFDPIGWKIKGVAIGARLAEFRAGQWDDRETSRRRCSERLGRLLVHAATRVPFYAERVRGLSPDDILADPRGSLAEFPILGVAGSTPPAAPPARRRVSSRTSSTSGPPSRRRSSRSTGPGSSAATGA